MSQNIVFGPKSLKQKLILEDDTTDVLLCGGGAGGSKSFSCLLKALKYVQDKNARVLIVRETFPVLKLPGGLIDESKRLYPPWGAVFKVQASTWIFPNGAEIKFAPIPQNIAEWQGLQATHILVDEAASQTEATILFLLGRLRGAHYLGHKNVTMTCNPDRNSFLYNWVEYCLDPDTGIPRPGTEDITRYFVSVNGILKWGDSPEQLYSEYGEGKEFGVDFIPKSFRFIPLTVYDNPVLLKNNPDYLGNLLNQDRVSQARFLHGSWTAKPSESSYFNRDWVEMVDRVPNDIVMRVRSYDLAASEVSEQNRNPDYTAGVLLSRDKFGMYYIENVIRYRKQPDNVLREMVKTAHLDGLTVPVSIPKDPGQGGIAANRFYIANLTEHGLIARSIVQSGHQGKVHKFLPFSALAQAGLVKVVRDTPDDRWNDEYFTELEQFTGGRNEKNDQVDATSDGINQICRQMVLPNFTIPSLTQPSPIPKI